MTFSHVVIKSYVTSAIRPCCAVNALVFTVPNNFVKSLHVHSAISLNNGSDIRTPRLTHRDVKEDPAPTLSPIDGVEYVRSHLKRLPVGPTFAGPSSKNRSRARFFWVVSGKQDVCDRLKITTF